MNTRLRLALLASAVAGALPLAAAAAETGLWPPKIGFASGDELALTGNLAYDINRFDGQGYAGAALDDDDAWRRQELGITLKRKGLYDFGATFDYQSKTWSDVVLRVETRPLAGRDLGKLRIGQMKLPLGMEGNTATRSVAFLEASLPTQAFYQGRRTGVDWAFERERYVANAGYFFKADLQGNNPGHTAAARLAWTPLKQPGRVLHLGVAAARENPDSEVNGLGVTVQPSVRWRAKPGSALTSVRLVDSGTLTRVDHIDRAGLEALWIDGPWSLQGEYLRQHTVRQAALPGYASDGWYVFGSWLATGESRPYSGGNVSNPKPKGKYGALELLLRYSRIDLDGDGIAGGRAHDWTLGANWYLAQNFKFQLGYVKTEARRGAYSADPSALQLRAQLHF